MNSKQRKKLFTLHGIDGKTFDALNATQQKYLIDAKEKVDITVDSFKAISQLDVGVAAGASDNQPEPSINDLGANTVGKRRGPSGPRVGDAMGAKPLVRKLMGTKVQLFATVDGVETLAGEQYPLMSIDDLCNATKKSEVNIRTILSDLRSPKYCGAGGVFKTVSTKVDGKTLYQYQE